MWLLIKCSLDDFYDIICISSVFMYSGLLKDTFTISESVASNGKMVTE